MMQKIAIFLFINLFFQHIAYAAVATFSIANTGISGTVTVNDRKIIVNLNLSQIDYSQLPGNTSCFTDGARYHIHTEWNYNDSNDRIGSSDCAASYTGYHWDPWTACSTSTGNEYCLNYASTSNYKCVRGSSAYTTDGTYTCNSSIYAENPFACEVSDFDGKYGRLYLTNDMFNRTDTSFWEVKSSDVQLKSIVFHCGSSNKRAFCAPFDSASDTSNQTLSQTDDGLTATFDQLNSKIVLESDGSYEVDIDLTSIKANLTCTDITYRIYNSWTGSDSSYIGNTECSSVVGKVYDPTITCLNNSDSTFCHSGIICNDSTYSYNCNNSDSRYTCSPSDLSGKYGNLKTDHFSIFKFLKKGTDDLMIPLELIEGKSIVLECSDYSTKIACAKFVESENDDDDEGNDLSKTDVILIVVFTIIGLVIISLGIYWYCKNSKMSRFTTEERSPLNQKQAL